MTEEITKLLLMAGVCGIFNSRIAWFALFAGSIAIRQGWA